jgi:hypothetical protein
MFCKLWIFNFFEKIFFQFLYLLSFFNFLHDNYFNFFYIFMFLYYKNTYL